MSFIRNASILGIAQVANILLALASRVVLSHSLGVANFGAFGAATNAMTVSSRTLSFGSASAAQYFASKVAAPRGTVIATSLGLAGIISLVAMAGQFVLVGPMQTAFFGQHPLGLQALLRMSWAMPFVVLAMNLGVMLIPFRRIREYGGLQVLSGGLFVFLCLGLLPFMAPLQAAVVAQITVWGATLGATLWFIRDDLHDLHWSGPLARQLLSFGFRSWPNGCLSIGIASFAVLFGARFMSPVELSVFVLAMNIVEGLFSPHVALGALVLSKQASEEEAAQPKVMRLLRTSLALFAGLFAAFALTGYWVIPFVFGPGFRPAYAVGLALFVTGASHAMLKTMGNAFAGMGRPGLTTVALAGEVLVLGCLLWTLGTTGLWGVVVASAVASIVGWGIALVQMRSLYRTSFSNLLFANQSDWRALRHPSTKLRKAA